MKLTCSVLIILVAGASGYIQVPKPACNEVSKTNVGRLKKAVFCGYDQSVRPVTHHTNRTSVKFGAFPASLSWIAEQKNQIWISFVIIMEWKDELLTWNTSDYDGLELFFTDSNKIWIPAFTVSFPVAQSKIMLQSSCMVNSSGMVQCKGDASISAHCSIDLTYFPHDRHACTLSLRLRPSEGFPYQLETITHESKNSLVYYRAHGSWDLLSFEVFHRQNKVGGEDELLYTFVIERKSSTYNVTYATPALVMVLMVLSVFWLEPQCSARVLLPALAIVSHLLIISWLMEAIQANFDHLPVVIMLFRDSLMMAGIALLWSVVCRSLSSCSASPYWLYMLSTRLNSSRLAKFLLPQDIFMKSGISGDEDESSLVVHRDCVEQQWRILTMLTDRLLFSFYILTYMVLFMRLTP